MADSTVVLGVTGIVVSGVVGPTVAAWMARRTRSREFHREQAAQRRDELRGLLNEAAGLLASGPTNLRILQASQPDAEDVERARSWLSQVFPIGQRLQLWLPGDHQVVRAYERVREQLVNTAEAGAAASRETLLERFEQDRRGFLDVSRQTLLSPIPETGDAL
ncbi:MAG TPA: hypothetical protein VM938_03450 [Acidimicrobiales bacterium]|nr:hypothetical protein [Acidimicrobiales bacterium]